MLYMARFYGYGHKRQAKPNLFDVGSNLYSRRAYITQTREEK